MGNKQGVFNLGFHPTTRPAPGVPERNDVRIFRERVMTKDKLLFLLFPAGALILWGLGFGPNDGFPIFVMSLIIIGVGSYLTKFAR